MNINKRILIHGLNHYGLPDDGKFEIDGKWIPVFNTHFRNNYRKHHYQTCPECGVKKKNIRLHYKKYHKEWFENTFIKPLKSGEIGQLYGVRFICT